MNEISRSLANVAFAQGRGRFLSGYLPLERWPQSSLWAAMVSPVRRLSLLLTVSPDGPTSPSYHCSGRPPTEFHYGRVTVVSCWLT
ncbi:hypothetical protein AAC387_Pa03g3445 [Persea americana]